MKGTPETPQCGFSRASIQILGLQGVDPKKFVAFNVLEDPELRQGKLISPNQLKMILFRVCSDYFLRCQGVLRLAYDPPAVPGQGVRWRMRHSDVDAPER
jgi:hypothetical protein